MSLTDDIRRTGRFKGCGFVSFYSYDSALTAMKVNGTMVLGRPIRVDFAADEKRGAADDDKGRSFGGGFRRGGGGGGRFRDGEDDSRYSRDDRGGRFGQDEGKFYLF